MWPIFTEKMIQNVSDVLRSGKVNQWTGTKVKDFEHKFAEYFGSNYAIAVANGTLALELCFRAIELGNEDEVIVTSRTFIASASSVVIQGGIPVFADVDLNSQNVTLDSIKSKITNKTKAVILVHLAGWPCNLEEICNYCKDHDIYVIEDCAQSIGAKFNDKYAGTWGDMAAWSFCQDKIITTGGEGGMITTNDESLYKKAWSYKDHGKGYDLVFRKTHPAGFRWLHESIGTNWRMTEMQASLGIDALEYLSEWILHRKKIAAIYNQNLLEVLGIRCTIPPKTIEHAYYKFYFFLEPEYFLNDARDMVINELNLQKINIFSGSCSEIYLEKAFDFLKIKPELTTAQLLGKTAFMLLCDPSITEDRANHDIKIIISTLQKYMKVA